MGDASGFSDWWKAVAEPVGNYFSKGFSDMADLVSGGSYSDFVSSRNDATDGWYSTIMDAVPLVRNVHNALLGRDSAKDYMDNNGLSWKDFQGYNTAKVTSNISNNLGGAIATSSKYLKNVNTDLGKLYANE